MTLSSSITELGHGDTAALSQKYRKRCVEIGGMVKDKEKLAEKGIDRSYSSSAYAQSIEHSRNNACEYISIAAHDAAMDIIRSRN